MLDVIHAVSVVLGITGALLVARRMPLAGQVVWIPSNALWIVYASVLHDWWSLALFGTYFVITVTGVVNYARARRRDRRG